MNLISSKAKLRGILFTTRARANARLERFWLIVFTEYSQKAGEDFTIAEILHWKNQHKNNAKRVSPQVLAYQIKEVTNVYRRLKEQGLAKVNERRECRIIKENEITFTLTKLGLAAGLAVIEDEAARA